MPFPSQITWIFCSWPRVDFFSIEFNPDGTLYGAWPLFSHMITGGQWDEDTSRLTFNISYDERDVDYYTGYLYFDPMSGKPLLAGILESYADSPHPEVTGWYAFADASWTGFGTDKNVLKAEFTPPTLVPGEASDNPQGYWQVIGGGGWKQLSVNLDPDGVLIAPSALYPNPVTGNFTGLDEPDGGMLKFTVNYEERVFDLYTGYALTNTSQQIVAFAGILESYSGDPNPDVSGWYATRQHAHSILDTDYTNRLQRRLVGDVEIANVNWSSGITANQTFLLNDWPIFEWVPILNGPMSEPNTELTSSEPETTLYNEIEQSPSAVAGWVVGAHDSTADLPFSHPFGNQLDFVFNIAPDEAYWPLLGISNIDHRKIAPWYHYDDELAKGMDEATAVGRGELNLQIPGLMHVEIDSALIPDRFRPTDGDRAIVFGRWIIDAGHDDLGTEIHPPLLTVRATPPDVETPQDIPELDTTTCTLIARPYLVGQTYSYDDQGVPRGLRAEALQRLNGVVSISGVDPNQQIELSAPILPSSIPFQKYPSEWFPENPGGWVWTQDAPILSFTLRPEALRQSQGDVLLVSWNITTGHGISFQVLDSGDEGVRVVVDFTAYQPSPAPLPKPNKRTVFLSDFPSDVVQQIQAMLQGIWLDIQRWLGTGNANNFLQVINNGVLMNIYEEVPAESPLDGTAQVIDQPVRSLVALFQNPSRQVVAVDDSQPYPIYGTITVRWKRA